MHRAHAAATKWRSACTCIPRRRQGALLTGKHAGRPGDETRREDCNEALRIVARGADKEDRAAA
jgi:hypothetical protein